MFWKRSKSLPKMLRELKELTVKYAKQETVDPLKGLIWLLLWGTLGSFCLAIGLILWVLAALRALQTETGTAFTNHLSWIPYLITFATCLIAVAFAAVAIGKDARAAKRRQQEKALTE
jgi:hypothetical protein